MRLSTDPFFRQLHQRLAEEIDNRTNVLASGGALAFNEKGSRDPISTAMKYQADVSYIEALRSVIELGFEMDHERYGTKKKTEDDE